MTIDYGTDFSVVSDFTADFATSSGRRLLAEACARRLVTPLGTLRRHLQYGYDVTAWVNDDVGPRELAQINAGVVPQLMRDERVLRCTCAASLAKDGTLTLDIQLWDAAGPFKLVLAVSQATVQIVSGP